MHSVFYFQTILIQLKYFLNYEDKITSELLTVNNTSRNRKKNNNKETRKFKPTKLQQKLKSFIFIFVVEYF